MGRQEVAHGARVAQRDLSLQTGEIAGPLLAALPIALASSSAASMRRRKAAS
jgi:hypothetical protein